ncbi:flagellar biosynthetic protein FliR [Psychrobacillus lasiicapitis]|uniref:Flagellar biosynthetic protein FliR n=1 Tax=Psychrobacillus lasiicapitis TaxID=1636719 RepID=A0A544TF92_9BACI|nr:flagellar biosynthetic protein FliR [Psychrobacillus lasiicapitis]TQR16056.1 flagellar type III secretion system protein FliR [Psychrobacillus lasiicapitis]GGA16060.1 flagellar biosynthetic protein FliR [Psychrobacillus lasiicapitis]
MEEIIPSLTVLLLIIARVSAFFVILPLFSHRTIPASHRIALAVVLSWMMYYTMDVEPFDVNGDYLLLIIKEVMVGLFIGLLAYIIMSAVQIAGGFIDFQMGFAIANVIDPQTGAQSPLVGQFLNTLALLLLLALNGHHLLLDGVFYSYQFIPMELMWPAFGQENYVEFIMRTFAGIFAVAFQMSIPIVATLFLVDIALGITARTVPQLNIFVIGFPIKIGVSFLVLLVMMGVLMAVVQKMFEIMVVSMRDLMIILGGG